MDTHVEFQRRIAKIALAAAADGDFALAGGAALREHGLTQRPTEDIDLFRSFGRDRDSFVEVVDAVRAALRDHGYSSTLDQLAEHGSFARLHISDVTGESVEMDMGEDYRADDPVWMEIGPVLSRDGIVGAKVATAYGRTYARDLIDLDSIRQTGAYTDRELYDMAKDTDPGVETARFQQSIRTGKLYADEEFTQYGMTAQQRAEMETRLEDFAQSLSDMENENTVPQPPNIHAAPLQEQLRHVADNTGTQRRNEGPGAGDTASTRPDTGPDLS